MVLKTLICPGFPKIFRNQGKIYHFLRNTRECLPGSLPLLPLFMVSSYFEEPNMKLTLQPVQSQVLTRNPER